MIVERFGNITLINGDCMEYMKTVDNGKFDLAIVDPPYGLNYARHPARAMHENKDWDDDVPGNDYFTELARVAKYRIIWGGNYFSLPPTQCFIFWYKHNPVDNFSDGELAWTNFQKPAKCFDFRYYGNLCGKKGVKEDKIHPTQKPVQLYEWLLMNYAEPGYKIIDTHGGSMSHAIAAHKLGFDLTIIEKDVDYYRKARKRLVEFMREKTLF